MKRTILVITGIIVTVLMVACNNISAPASSSTASPVASRSVAEVKDDYIAIGGKTPYEVLTATEEQAIKKAEEEARLQAEAKAKAEAEAKAKAQQQAQQAEASQQTEQTQEVQQNASTGHDYTTPAPAGHHWYTFPSGQRVLLADSAEIAHAAVDREVAELEARGYYGKNKDDVPPEWKEARKAKENEQIVSAE